MAPPHLAVIELLEFGLAGLRLAQAVPRVAQLHAQGHGDQRDREDHGETSIGEDLTLQRIVHRRGGEDGDQGEEHRR
ncbi:hypothetical protein [Aurantimonas coralicida]|uniref:hypothetical protein n=1 Tax=Aurantimonas coralicida TaxID=182270 RepID=UPI001E5ED1E1|nr:hypothetical protein [Aurantimonas coralicida]MCD1643719.1 hypothetical protein [Aurantimonas coralicida]